MTTWVLNVGLRDGDNSEEVHKICAAAHISGLVVDRFEEQEDEGTLVMEVWPVGDISTSLMAMCQRLGRQAIAASQRGYMTGLVVGPEADIYGPFDPARFIEFFYQEAFQ